MSFQCIYTCSAYLCKHELCDFFHATTGISGSAELSGGHLQGDMHRVGGEGLPPRKEKEKKLNSESTPIILSVKNNSYCDTNADIFLLLSL